MFNLSQLVRLLLAAVCILFTCGFAVAQNNLNRIVTVNVKQQKIADILTSIGKQGNFYFSYSNSWIPTDSVVNVSVSGMPVRVLLDMLFNGKVDYKESPGYVILRPAPYRLSVQPENFTEPDNTYIISGYVIDEQTGTKLANASIYEKHLLVSTLTDRNGFFEMKIKHASSVTLTVSKDMYRDTSINFLSDVKIYRNRSYGYYDADTVYRKVERSWLGNMFITSKQKIQSLNLGGFIAAMPVQMSLTPGLGSHGLMSGQVVDKVSLNLIGGYNAGVNGVEFAGVFNLNKHDVKYIQAAGVSNATGGTVTGAQFAGISNIVYRNVKGAQASGVFNVDKENMYGFQASGMANKVKLDMEGFQAAGAVNRVGGQMRGFQASGVANINKQNTTGFQAAGAFNSTGGDFKGFQASGVLNRAGGNAVGFRAAALANISGNVSNGLQIAGVFNKARVLKGLSISPVTIADTLVGCAFSLLSISKNGYHNVVVYTDELHINTIGFKSGNAKLYTKLFAGVNLTDSTRYYTYGIAFGHDFILSNRASLSTEASIQPIMSGNWKGQYALNKLKALLNIAVTRKLGLFAGPSFTLLQAAEAHTTSTELAQLTSNKIGYKSYSDGNKSWIGWTFGITLF